MPTYARDTDVPVDRTITQLKALIERFGADHFAFMTSQTGATIAFRYHGRAVRFDLPLPDRNDERFLTTPTGRARKNPNASYAAWESECRSLWRNLYLLVKALFAAIECSLLDFDRAFMHDIVTPNGKTVGQRLLGDIQTMISSGKNAPLLLENQ